MRQERTHFLSLCPPSKSSFLCYQIAGKKPIRALTSEFLRIYPMPVFGTCRWQPYPAMVELVGSSRCCSRKHAYQVALHCLMGRGSKCVLGKAGSAARWGWRETLQRKGKGFEDFHLLIQYINNTVRIDGRLADKKAILTRSQTEMWRSEPCEDRKTWLNWVRTLVRTENNDCLAEISS